MAFTGGLDLGGQGVSTHISSRNQRYEGSLWHSPGADALSDSGLFSTSWGFL